MYSLARDNGLKMLEFARRVTLAYLEDIPPDQRFHQPAPGANHAVWIIGHLTVVDDSFLSTLQGTEHSLTSMWREAFAQGSDPGTDPSQNPDWDELMKRFAAIRTDLLTWFRNLPDEKLEQPLPENLKGFASSQCALMSSIAWHEAIHAGQITTIRKSLGLDRRFG